MTPSLIKGLRPAATNLWLRVMLGLAAVIMMTSAPAQEGVHEPARPQRAFGGIGLSFNFNLAQPAPDHEPGELLILWHEADEAAEGQKWMRDRYGLEPEQVDQLDALGLIMGQYKFGQSPSAQEVKKQLRRDQPLWVVDFNTRNSLLADSATLPVPPLPRLYALKQMGLGTAGVGRSASLKLGVADTGFDLATPLRVSRLVVHDVLGAADAPAPTDHGTAIASLIAGAPLGNGFVGASHGLELFWARTVRMSDGQPRSNTAIMSRAVNWLAQQGATAINISQGGPGDDVLKEVFAQLVGRLVLVVAAAGNGGPRAAPVFPAAYPGVLAVTAVDADLHPYAQANRGGYISLSAPGVDVWVPSTMPDQNLAQPRGGRYVSGTSFASALVAGSLAQANEGLWQVSSNARIDRLCRSARDLGELGRDPVFGCGLWHVPNAETHPPGGDPSK